MKTQKLYPSYRRSSHLLHFITVLLVLVCQTTQVKILSDTTLRKIFEKNQKVLIYVCEDQNPQKYNRFSNFCIDHSCAYLDKNNELYENIRNFVGYQSKEYLLILDASKQLKYVKEINDTFGQKFISSFWNDFKSHKLQPYFSSEEQPTEIFEPCRKLVGSNFDEFLSLPAPIKVVYLYTEKQDCEACGQMLKGFQEIAVKIYRQDVIAFGYFDIYSNDHPKIPSEIAPYFLVFKQGQIEPYGIEGEMFPELQKGLINIVAEHIYPDYRKQQENEENEQIQIEDLVQIQPFEIDERDQLAATTFEL